MRISKSNLTGNRTSFIIFDGDNLIEIKVANRPSNGEDDSGEMVENLSVKCGFCFERDCFGHCEGAQQQIADEITKGITETQRAIEHHQSWNAAVGGFTSLLLALAASGHDLQTMESAIASAFDSISNEFGG